MQRFGVVGPPTILFLDPKTGQELAPARTIGTIDADGFLQKLTRRARDGRLIASPCISTGSDAWPRRTFLSFAALSHAWRSCLNGAGRAAELAFAHVTPKGVRCRGHQGRAQKKPVLAYFTAEWCPICKSIDSRVFSNPVIKRRLERIALVRADVTAVDAGNGRSWNTFGCRPPTMFVIDPKDGREMPRTRLTGAVDANLFLDTINLAGL